MKTLLIASLLAASIAVSIAAPTTELPEEQCEQEVNCLLPNCLCPSVQHPQKPGEYFGVEQTPQFVVLSFDDAVTISNFKFYEELKALKNPNQCKISMTFFVSHTYTNYSMVNELHRLGHEIALHSITHKSDVQNYWRPGNVSVWKDEMKDLRTIITKHAKIDEDQIKGWRAPFLEVGGDEMYTALEETGLQYDCSWPTLQYTNWYGDKPKGALWPYTLDYPSIQDQQLGTPPTKAYKGLWVAPMVDLNDNQGEACAMLDSCRSLDDELLTNAQAVTYFLKRNFNLNYKNNRAPFGLYAHHSWFLEGDILTEDARRVGFRNFLEWLLTKDDVWIVSMDRVLAWMKNPVPSPTPNLGSDEDFGCTTFDPLSNCETANDYEFLPETHPNVPPGLSSVRMSSCIKPQPKNYPWLHDPYGNGTNPA